MTLSNRQRQILAFIVSGRSNKEIAADLGLSIETVKAYRKNICSKFNLHSTAQLAVFAMEHGLRPGASKSKIEP